MTDHAGPREHVHLIGIGGTGMTALAGLLHEAGCRVTGSDRALYPPTSTILEEMGIEVGVGFDPGRLEPVPDLVVVGNAVRRGNPEAEAVLDRGWPYASMPETISRRFLAGRHVITVCGTHGKTTTTSMLAWVLDRAGLDPGYLIGGQPLDLERPYRIGAGAPFVIEGDEYDTAFFDKGPKFQHYRPRTAILGTVEFDHADIFRDLDHVERVFRWLPNLVPSSGLLIRHEDSETTRRVTDGAPCRVEGFGIDLGTWRATGVSTGPDGTRFTLERGGERLADVRLQLPGEHNVRNALAVAAAAADLGVSAEAIARGLDSFRGVRRRLEVRGEAGGIAVLDDFAHHPTAIAGTLETVALRYPGRRVWAVVEPRSWSMRRNVFQDRLPQALAPADAVVLTRVYGAEEIPEGERLDPERLVRDLATRGTEARFLDDAAAIVDHLGVEAREGDVVVVMSNGGFDGLHARLLASFGARAETA